MAGPRSFSAEITVSLNTVTLDLFGRWQVRMASLILQCTFAVHYMQSSYRRERLFPGPAETLNSSLSVNSRYVFLDYFDILFVG